MDLESLRKKIDALDSEIIEKLNERVKLAIEIGQVKLQSGQEVYAPSREVEVFRKLSELNSGPLPLEALHSIYREVISATTVLQKPLTIAYLGPEGTYTEQAARKNFGSSVQYQSMGTIADVFSGVERGESDYGVIPIENSTEGAVEEALDILVDTELTIVAQIYLAISLSLISHADLSEIRSVHSKDNALGQCRQWLGRGLPHADRVEMKSTVEAVLHAAANHQAAAIASRLAAEKYGVPVVAEDIQDKIENFTRFFVLGLHASGQLGNGRDRSSFVFSLNDEPGALQKALEPFSRREINLCKIESRPSRRKLWDYFFFIDIIGHYDDDKVQEALAELSNSCSMVKWLGSYPNE